MWVGIVVTFTHWKRWWCFHCFILRSLRSSRFSLPGRITVLEMLFHLIFWFSMLYFLTISMGEKDFGVLFSSSVNKIFFFLSLLHPKRVFVLRSSRDRKNSFSTGTRQWVQSGRQESFVLHEERSWLPQQMGWWIWTAATPALWSGETQCQHNNERMVLGEFCHSKNPLRTIWSLLCIF